MDESIENQHLNQVIYCLKDQQKDIHTLKMSPESIPMLYQSTKKLLQTFDQHFNRCKKYNQAKIHRKYQIIIQSLAQQNKTLKYKIAMQLQSRPGSQKYVSDLIDKMIQLKNTNEKLTKQNINLKNIIQKYQENSKLGLIGSKNDDQNPEYKDMMKKEWQKILIRDTNNKYFRMKRQQEISHLDRTQSNFQKFLIFNHNKLDKWYLIDLFQRIQKWTNNLKDVRYIDKNKIKSQLQKSFINLNKTNTSVPEKSHGRGNETEITQSLHKQVLKTANSKKVKTEVKQPYFAVIRKSKGGYRSNLSNYGIRNLN